MPLTTNKNMDSEPVDVLEVFNGYQHKEDSTKLPPATLTAPSVNVMIPQRDEIVPRGGTTLQGQSSTQNSYIRGNAEKFKNISGIEMEVRVWKDIIDLSKKDVVEVFYKNPITGEEKYWQITENLNPLVAGVNERYYFTEWVDTNLNLGVPSPSSLNLPRLIWVDGSSTAKSWPGGISPIYSLSPSTITCAPGTTWAALGFVDVSLGGTGVVVVNGQPYTATSGWFTDTLDIGSSAGITVGDVAFAQVEEITTPVEFDNVDCNQSNYVIYGQEGNRQGYMSNAFNRSATQEITGSQAVQNDMIVTGGFTGTGRHVIRYQIDAVSPSSQRYFLSFSGSAENMRWIETDYSQNARNTYRVVITDVTPGSEKFSYYKNNSLVAANVNITEDVEQNLIDGLSINFLSIAPSLYVLNTAFVLIIGGRDTYAWYVDNILQASGINVTTALVYNGVNMKVENVRGHTKGDFWEVSVDQKITNAWANFYYGLPRKIGEGYIFRLPSAFWAIKGQERESYINCANGRWVYVETVLSADLLTEQVNIVPLKQASSNKVLHPYMITNMENDLVFVNDQKAINFIGRKELLELPQVSNLSDLIKLDLMAASFTGGSMKYTDAKLFITSPRDIKNVMFVYDNAPTTKYWQPPQEIPQNGILSSVGNDLISHSSIRNETNIIMQADVYSDNGSGFLTRIRTANNTYGNRWKAKTSTASFIEGRMEGLSQFFMDLVMCDPTSISSYTHVVDPIFAVSQNRATLGNGGLGTHPLGMDVQPETPVFRERFPFPPKLFYFSAFDLLCYGKGQKWRIYSLGLAVYDTEKLNGQLLAKKTPLTINN